MPDTTNTQQPAVSSFPQPGVPFHDLTKWATKAPEGETLISTAYKDKVTEDLRFVENKPGVHKPDPILIADNVTRKFGGMTAVDMGHFESERCRQDHVLQSDDRLRYAEYRHLAVRRQGHGPRAT